MFKFKVGDRVRYVSGRWGNSPLNPLWNTQKIAGTIKELLTNKPMFHYGEPFKYVVTWDNGAFACNYLEDDLDYDEDEIFIAEIRVPSLTELLQPEKYYEV